jgi:hypothetical protein
MRKEKIAVPQTTLSFVVPDHFYNPGDLALFINDVQDLADEKYHFSNAQTVLALTQIIGAIASQILNHKL